jgi:hypothetical protein
VAPDVESTKNTKVICAASLLDHALVQKQHHLLPDNMKESLMAGLSFCLKDKAMLADCRTTGAILFHLASIESHQKIPDLDVALSLANDSVTYLKQVVETFDDPKASDYQLVMDFNVVGTSLVADQHSGSR